MYAGYESMSSLAGELENPQIIPKAIIIALPLIIGTYVLPTIASLGYVGQWESWGSDGVSYVNVAMQYAPAFGVAFMLVAFISNISMFNVYLASGARGFFVMAEDNLAPKALTKCDKKHGVPYVAILSLSIAVSYTHLDVYKRQGKDRSFTFRDPTGNLLCGISGGADRSQGLNHPAHEKTGDKMADD